MIRDYQAVMKTWFPKGKQRIIPTYGKQEGVKLVGCPDYETGRVYVEEHRKYDAEVFLQFLKNVLSQYPHGKTVVMLDNAKIHHAKLPESFLKDSVINNVFFHTREEIREAVQRSLRWLSTVPRMAIGRLCL